MLSSLRDSPISSFPDRALALAENKKKSTASQVPSPDIRLPSGVPSLDAREQASRSLSYTRIFIPPEGQSQAEELLSRFIELYWDRMSTSVFGQQNNLEQDLETLRLQCEKEMSCISALDEKTKNNLRLKLVQDCGPLFLKSLADPALKNKAALGLLAQPFMEEKDRRKCLVALKRLEEKEAQALLAILQDWIPSCIDSNLEFCKYILNTLEDKQIVKSLILGCFKKSLYIGRYEPLLAILENRDLKNDICLELLMLPHLNLNAQKTFLGYIQAKTQEDIGRKDKCLEGLLLRQLHLSKNTASTFFIQIQDESLKACLILYFLSKRFVKDTRYLLLAQYIQAPCLRYWICLVLDTASLEGAKALAGLQDALGVNLRKPFPKIDDYSQAQAFITQFLRYSLGAIQFEQGKLEAAFIAFLNSLEGSIREEVLYRLCLDASLTKPLREFAARHIEDPILKERYLHEIQNNIDTKRFSAMKVAGPQLWED